MGRRRGRGRLRRGRLARSLRHQLRPQRALSQPRQRPVRERGPRDRSRGARLEHGCRLLRCGRRRRPRPLRGFLHRLHPAGRPGREAHSLLARARAGSGGPVRPQGRPRPLLPERRGQAFRGRHGGGGDVGPWPGLRLRGSGRRLRRPRPPRRLRGQRLRPQLPLSERGGRRLQGGRHVVGRGPRRERCRPGQHGPRRGRRGRRRRARRLHHEFLRGLLDPLSRAGRRPLRGRLEAQRHRPCDLPAPVLGHRLRRPRQRRRPRPGHRQRTHLSPDRPASRADRYLRPAGASSSRTAAPLERRPSRTSARRQAPASSRSGRAAAWPSGTSTTTAPWTSSSAASTHLPPCSATRRPRGARGSPWSARTTAEA